MGEKGFTAAGANLDKLIAKGMTDTPKVRFDNSIMRDVEKEEAAADKAKNDALPADINAGAPPVDAEVSTAKAMKALERMAKDAPNPNAKPEDPATDPAAAAKRDNDMEKSAAAKGDAKEAPKKASLIQKMSQGYKDDEAAANAAKMATTKIESVRGPPGAPIGYGVHKLAIEGGNPYAFRQE
jgi:hypothetical protein